MLRQPLKVALLGGGVLVSVWAVHAMYTRCKRSWRGEANDSDGDEDSLFNHPQQHKHDNSSRHAVVGDDTVVPRDNGAALAKKIIEQRGYTFSSDEDEEGEDDEEESINDSELDLRINIAHSIEKLTRSELIETLKKYSELPATTVGKRRRELERQLVKGARNFFESNEIVAKMEKTQKLRHISDGDVVANNTRGAKERKFYDEHYDDDEVDDEVGDNDDDHWGEEEHWDGDGGDEAWGDEEDEYEDENDAYDEEDEAANRAYDDPDEVAERAALEIAVNAALKKLLAADAEKTPTAALTPAAAPGDDDDQWESVDEDEDDTGKPGRNRGSRKPARARKQRR